MKGAASCLAPDMLLHLMWQLVHISVSIHWPSIFCKGLTFLLSELQGFCCGERQIIAVHRALTRVHL